MSEKKVSKFNRDWYKMRFHLPMDDFDEDDEMDERIARAKKKKRNRVRRGEGIRGTQ